MQKIGFANEERIGFNMFDGPQRYTQCALVRKTEFKYNCVYLLENSTKHLYLYLGFRIAHKLPCGINAGPLVVLQSNVFMGGSLHGGTNACH